MRLLCKAACWAGLVTALGAAAVPTFASTASTSINGFNDPGGFTLTANADGGSGTPPGVPAISGGTLRLTTSQTAPGGGLYGNANASAYYNQKQYVGQFYTSFVYHYNGSSHQSLGPGNGFTFILQNDPRGLHALGTTGLGNGQQGDGGTVQNSAAVEFGLFTGFGQARGTMLSFNGDPGPSGTFRVPGPVKLVGANPNDDDYAPSDPIYVTLFYDGATLTETLTDTVTQAMYSTSYSADLPAAVGGGFAYVGFTGGTGGAVSDQYITDFTFSNGFPAPPLNSGPIITISANAVQTGPGHVQVNVTLTNSGGATADFNEITGISLNGGTTTSALPTTPNLLAPGHSQTNSFAFTVPPGTTHAPLKVGGQYVDTRTNGTGRFSGSFRSLLIAPAN